MSSHRPSVRVAGALLSGLLALVLLPPVARAATTVEVRIGASLDPAAVTVAPGTTVTWVNADGDRHRMRSVAGPDQFDSGNLEPGDRFSHTFTLDGTTNYIDDRNEDDTRYHGTVVVSTGAPPAPEPDPTDTTGPSQPATHTVSMLNRRFTPRTLEITTGDTVRFLNDDDRDHTATADDRSFDSGILRSGQAFSRSFTRAGTFNYLCLLHPDMVGTIAVADPGGSAPPPAHAPAPTPAGAEPAPTTAPSTGNGVAAPQRRTVEMRDFSFSPARIEVPAGSTIVFSNTGRALHTATAEDGSFDSDLVSPGGAYERRFDRAGTFAYTCLLHPEMVGEVVVTATGADPPPATGSSGAGDGTTAGDAGRTATPPRAPGTVLVSLRDFSFAPGDVQLQVGDTVRFRNDGQALHTATARDGTYDSGLLRSGEIGEHTFQQAGTFDYWCTLHPQMVATIRVAAVDGTVPAADPDVVDGAGSDGGGGEEAADGGADPSDPARVSMVDNEFLPEVVEVTVGQEVVWTNDGAAVHTVTAEDQAFDSGLVAAGDSFRMAFDEPGTVAYLCVVHPGMTGEVRVLALAEDAAGAAGGAGAAGTGGRLSVAALELLMLGAFAVALAGFTVLARRFGTLHASADG